jgi:hypothetical protein
VELGVWDVKVPVEIGKDTFGNTIMLDDVG